MTEELTNKIKEVLPKMEGWCVPEKALNLARYITEEYFKYNGKYPESVVELGVFGGKSLIPMALALKHNFEKHGQKGVAVGIDMWCKEAAYEGDIGKINVDYWEQVPFAQVVNRMNEVIKEEALEPYIQLQKGKSYEMGYLFGEKSIDILHQDSSHSTETSLKELDIYLPLMKDGCIWIMDDVDWTDSKSSFALHPAYNKLLENGFMEIEDVPATDLQSHYKVLRL